MASPTKKMKFEGCEYQDGDLIKPFRNFEIVKLLSDNSQRKMACVQGRFQGKEENAVVILEKTPFSKDVLDKMLTEESLAHHTLQNDIYGTHVLFPGISVNGIKSTLIYPATDKHIEKYSTHEMHIITETEEDYKQITLPHLESDKFSIKWVYNILEHKSEADRIVFEDENPETGFILLPDMKWDRMQMEDLQLVGIVHKKGILSLRSLTTDHLPLLKNILEKGQTAIENKFQVPRSKLRIFLHYQPSYYHLHVHFTHLKCDGAGSGVERAHLLNDVINNIELMGDYYQKKTLSFVVKENAELYKKYKKNGRL